jgi:hypothetical protein
MVFLVETLISQLISHIENTFHVRIVKVEAMNTSNTLAICTGSVNGIFSPCDGRLTL